jgi:hypothetical protein
LADAYVEKANASEENLSKLRAQGMDTSRFGGYDLSKYVSVREDGSLDTSQGSSGEGLQYLYNNVDEETKDKIKEYIEDYNSEWQEREDSLQGLRDTIDEIKDFEEEGKDAYYELRDMAKETILGALQKQIDIQQQTLDATKSANTNLINKIQEQIDDARTARENEQAKENIANLQSQQAYLAMDTSGANALQMQNLDTEIE